MAFDAEKYMKDQGIEAFSDVEPRDGGPYSLYCKTCGTWVPNTANHEMRKEGCFAHSHHCVKYTDGRIEVNGKVIESVSES